MKVMKSYTITIKFEFILLFWPKNCWTADDFCYTGVAGKRYSMYEESSLKLMNSKINIQNRLFLFYLFVTITRDKTSIFSLSFVSSKLNHFKAYIRHTGCCSIVYISERAIKNLRLLFHKSLSCTLPIQTSQSKWMEIHKIHIEIWKELTINGSIQLHGNVIQIVEHSHLTVVWTKTHPICNKNMEEKSKLFSFRLSF